MAARSSSTLWLWCRVLLVFFQVLVAGVNAEKADTKRPKASYAPGDLIPVQCLNRTIDTGEHITDSLGQLQYVPFPICNETGRSLELLYGVESEINCTLPIIDDPLFHLLEFYIHNDAPLTCRIPSRPAAASSPPFAPEDKKKDTSQQPISIETQPDDYIPLIFALSGTLQLSHLHICPRLNVVLHTSIAHTKKEQAQRSEKRRKGLADDEEGAIIAATAYSTPSLTSASTRIIIGDPLALRLNVHWYSTPDLPPSTTATRYLMGEHVHLSTLVYCFLSAGGGAMGALAYFRGVELPRRLRRYGKDRMGGERGYAFPGNGWAGSGVGGGKRD